MPTTNMVLLIILLLVTLYLSYRVVKYLISCIINAPLAKLIFSKNKLKALDEVIHKYNLNLNAKNQQGLTPLLLLLNFSQNSYFTNPIIRSLLQHKKTDVNATDNDGNTALHYVIRSNNIKILKALCSHPKIKINIKNKKTHTPLHLACSIKSKPKIIKILLTNKDIDINLKNCDGKTPLDIAKALKLKKVVTLLQRQK
jgi:ankyrin repeat protein